MAADSIEDFGSISLVGTIYKIILKVSVGRIKEVLGLIIAHN